MYICVKGMSALMLVTIICVNLLPTTYCQLSESSTTLDLISDGMKSIFGFDHVMKTFKKISSGMIPFPLFVPIIPKTKVIDLWRRKKTPKESGNQESLEQISESNAKVNKLPVQSIQSMQSMQIPAHLLAKLNPNYQQISDQMFFNLRPQEMLPEMPFMTNEGLSGLSTGLSSGLTSLDDQSTVEEDMRPNDVELDNSYEPDAEESNSYSERFESGLAGNTDDYNTSDEHRTPSAQEVIHNWQIIDEELKKIGHQLGKLGKYLNRN